MSTSTETKQSFGKPTQPPAVEINNPEDGIESEIKFSNVLAEKVGQKIELGLVKKAAQDLLDHPELANDPGIRKGLTKKAVEYTNLGVQHAEKFDALFPSVKIFEESEVIDAVVGKSNELIDVLPKLLPRFFAVCPKAAESPLVHQVAAKKIDSFIELNLPRLVPAFIDFFPQSVHEQILAVSKLTLNDLEVFRKKAAQHEEKKKQQAAVNK